MDRRRLVFFPLPLQGHQTPMLQLASILYSKGFSISIIHTNFNSPNPANYPDFTFHCIPDNLSESEASTEDLTLLLHNLNTNCVATFEAILSQLMSKFDVACLITDIIWYFTQAVADSFDLPRIVLRTNNPSSFMAFTYLPLFREKGYLSAQGTQLEEPVQELPPLKKKDIPRIYTRFPELNDEVTHKLMETTKAARGLVFNSFEELEGSSFTLVRQHFQIPVFAIGPFQKQVKASFSSLLVEDRSCIPWLSAQPPKSVLYVSFGSIAAIDETQFHEIAWGLAHSKQPFLWVIRPGLVRGLNGRAPLPNGFLEIVMGWSRIVGWAPQEEVLAHPAVGGFWTHCGWNSILESICQGVPMICLPFFGDQMNNARYVTDVWRVGLRFEKGLKREDIEKGVRSLMVLKEGKEMTQRVVVLQEKASLCIEKGGSSYQSLESLVAHILSF
ncbi:UDP-glycosyltransferase 76B1-like [Chenopodium quinoa]|uniref:UDP-glycosyltransferase 76B1-like n=1 Tax=Chenopodium quinoa TaxID=63459 RepID=UPI000B7951EB|nr:UDP-glycosyltransferase 76B1-like [Chenopodium quinoa]